MNMKTWTNPSVEELEVEKTAAIYSCWQVEEANGKLDDSLIHGHDPVAPGEGEGNEGGEGNQGDEGFGNES